jgi:5-methylcytosine-specific restriction endonuclease McrA
MGVKLHIKGQKFNGLIALRFDRMENGHRSVWVFKCFCGKQKAIRAERVIHGTSRSCGCSRILACCKRGHKRTVENVLLGRGCRICSNAIKRKLRKENPEKYNKPARRWCKENIEKVRAYCRAYAKSNPDKIKIAHRKYRKEHPEAVLAYKAKRRAQKAGNGGAFTTVEWKILCKKYHYRCLRCKRRRKLTADHVIPISKRGTSNIENIQPLCKPCNSHKGTKTTDYRKRELICL